MWYSSEGMRSCLYLNRSLHMYHCHIWCLFLEMVDFCSISCQPQRYLVSHNFLPSISASANHHHNALQQSRNMLMSCVSSKSPFIISVKKFLCGLLWGVIPVILVILTAFHDYLTVLGVKREVGQVHSTAELCSDSTDRHQWAFMGIIQFP